MSRKPHPEEEDLFAYLGVTQLEELNENFSLDLDENAWRDLAFKAARCDSVGILKWLVETKKVSLLLTDHRSRSLLHMSVVSHSYQVVYWLASNDELFCIRNSRYRTPFDVALLSGWHKIVRLLAANLDSLSIRKKHVLERACTFAKPEQVLQIRLLLREDSLQSEAFKLKSEDTSPLQELLQKAKLGPWSWKEEKCLRHLFGNFAAMGDIEGLQLLREHVQLLPREEKQLSTVDRILWPLGFNLEDLGGPGDTAHGRQMLEILDIFLGHSWDGTVENFDALWQEKLQELSQGFVAVYHTETLMGMRNLIPHKNRDNEELLQSLRFLSKNYDSFGPWCLPSLDTVAIGGETKVLAFMLEDGLFDPDQRLFASEMKAEGDAETAEVAHDDCSVCMEANLAPQTLLCGHKFCTSCTWKILDGYPEITCPLCRHTSVVPKKTLVECQFAACLPISAPWLTIESGMKTSEVLLFLCAGAGSLWTFLWVMEQFQLDLRGVKSNGKNVAHMAAMFSRLAICRWLNENGYDDLFSEKDGDGFTPVHWAMCSNVRDSLVPYLKKVGLFPEDWLEFAIRECPDEMESWIRKKQQKENRKKLISLLYEDAPLENFLEIFPTTPWGYGLREAEWIESFLELVIKRGRADVLKELYTAPQLRFDTDHYLPVLKALPCGQKKEELQQVFDDISWIHTTFSYVYEKEARIEAWIEAGDLERLKRFGKKVKALKSSAPSGYGKFHLKPYFLASCNVKPITVALTKGHYTLLDWLLKQRLKIDKDPNKLLKLSEVKPSRLRDLDNGICATLEQFDLRGLQWMFTWIFEHGSLDFNTEDYLDTIVFWYRDLFREPNEEKRPEDWESKSWEIFEYAARHPAIRVTKKNVLTCLLGYYHAPMFNMLMVLKDHIDISKFSTEFMDAIFKDLQWSRSDKKKSEELLRILTWAVLEKGMILRACKSDLLSKEAHARIENLRIQQRKMMKAKEMDM